MGKNTINKVLSLFTLIIILIISLILSKSYYDYKYALNKNLEHIEYINKQFENSISNLMRECKYHVETDINNIAKNMQDEILLKYKNNIYDLQFDISNPTSNSELTRIFDKYMTSKYVNKDTMYNKIFIISKSNILWNNSIRTPNMKLDDIFNNQNNILDEIFNTNNIKEFVIWNNNTCSESIDEFNLSENAKYSLENKTIQNFKNYDILIPIYITKDGDIFGNKDLNEFGKENTNFKIICIQRINIYDLLSKYNDSFISSFDEMNNFNYSIKQEQITRITDIIKLIIFIIIIFCISANIQNSIIKKEISGDKK